MQTYVRYNKYLVDLYTSWSLYDLTIICHRALSDRHCQSTFLIGQFHFDWCNTTNQSVARWKRSSVDKVHVAFQHFTWVSNVVVVLEKKHISFYRARNFSIKYVVKKLYCSTCHQTRDVGTNICWSNNVIW